jgi:hypothetical protein
LPSDGLKVVDGIILLPDLRTECETREGEIAGVDLVLATEHCKAGQMSAMARAGFKFYMPGSPPAPAAVPSSATLRSPARVLLTCPDPKSEQLVQIDQCPIL